MKIKYILASFFSVMHPKGLSIKKALTSCQDTSSTALVSCVEIYSFLKWDNHCAPRSKANVGYFYFGAEDDNALRNQILKEYRLDTAFYNSMLVLLLINFICYKNLIFMEFLVYVLILILAWLISSLDKMLYRYNPDSYSKDIKHIAYIKISLNLIYTLLFLYIIYKLYILNCLLNYIIKLIVFNLAVLSLFKVSFISRAIKRLHAAQTIFYIKYCIDVFGLNRILMGAFLHYCKQERIDINDSLTLKIILLIKNKYTL